MFLRRCVFDCLPNHSRQPVSDRRSWKNRIFHCGRPQLLSLSFSTPLSRPFCLKGDVDVLRRNSINMKVESVFQMCFYGALCLLKGSKMLLVHICKDGKSEVFLHVLFLILCIYFAHNYNKRNEEWCEWDLEKQPHLKMSTSKYKSQVICKNS